MDTKGLSFDKNHLIAILLLTPNKILLRTYFTLHGMAFSLIN